MALAQPRYPGWLDRLLTHPVERVENYAEMMRLWIEVQIVIETFVEVSED